MNAPRSCASCDETGCAMNARHGVTELPAERAAFILDDVWPEYASMVAEIRRPADQLIAPGLVGRPGLARYSWPGAVEHRATVETAQRHLTMRRVAKAPGGVRQRAYLERDAKLGAALAGRIDYRARHLVIAQNWLVPLDRAGVLGGRSYDVLMNRYPFAEIHRLLDRAACEVGPSDTISDFRAPDVLVERETRLLASARHIVTPHYGIGSLFPGQWTQLAWHRPPHGAANRGERTAYLGPSLSRNRPDIARRIALNLDQPLIVIGDFPGASAWEGVMVEHRSRGPGMFDDVGRLIHPATMTTQPRALLTALARDIVVCATPPCGLAPEDYEPLTGFPAAPQPSQ